MALSRARAPISSLFTSFLRPFCTSSEATKSAIEEYTTTHDVCSQVGNCMPLSLLRIGSIIHNIELRPGQGAKLVRAAGTSAKILKLPSTGRCLIRLPSGCTKLIDIRCRATVGVVSNPTHGSLKLRKAGQNRWRGIRPTVRGVAMNPIDHPHGGGEGKSKGNLSQTPWGKPTKGGYKTACPRKKNRLI